MIIGEVARILAFNGLSVKKAAEITGISRPTIDKMKNGMEVRSEKLGTFLSVIEKKGYRIRFDDDHDAIPQEVLAFSAAHGGANSNVRLTAPPTPKKYSDSASLAVEHLLKVLDIILRDARDGTTSLNAEDFEFFRNDFEVCARKIEELCRVHLSISIDFPSEREYVNSQSAK